MNPLHALLAFTFLTLLLVASVFLYRGFRFVTGAPINGWARGAKSVEDPTMIKRMEDAHANCLENLPIFAIIVFAAITMGQLEIIAPFAQYVFYARIGQSLAHLAGTDRPHVFVRATFWSIQLGLFLLMTLKLLNLFN
jgi:uncharacterized MAPEG superfamily protein